MNKLRLILKGLLLVGIVLSLASCNSTLMSQTALADNDKCRTLIKSVLINFSYDRIAIEVECLDSHDNVNVRLNSTDIKSVKIMDGLILAHIPGLLVDESVVKYVVTIAIEDKGYDHFLLELVGPEPPTSDPNKWFVFKTVFVSEYNNPPTTKAATGELIWEIPFPFGVDEKRCKGKCNPKCKKGSSCKKNLLGKCRCFSDKTGDPTYRER